MAQRQRDGGLGGYVGLAIVAFLVGRCSAETPPATVTQAAAPVVAAAPIDAPTQPAPVAALLTAPAVEEQTTTELEPEPEPAREQAADEFVYYQNCSAARAAGVTPIRGGDPGYASHLDRDGDGVACE